MSTFLTRKVPSERLIEGTYQNALTGSSLYRLVDAIEEFHYIFPNNIQLRDLMVRLTKELPNHGTKQTNFIVYEQHEHCPNRVMSISDINDISQNVRWE